MEQAARRKETKKQTRTNGKIDNDRSAGSKSKEGARWGYICSADGRYHAAETGENEVGRVRPGFDDHLEVFDTKTYLGDELAECGNAVEGNHAKKAEGLFICAL